jgi:hypothetical protein
MVLKLGERGFKFVFNLIVGTFSHDIIPPERLGKLCAIGQAYYRPRLILGAGQVAVSQTRSSSLRTRVKDVWVIVIFGEAGMNRLITAEE